MVETLPIQETRATSSCTECQRRKQKCSREWPCNHCQARKVPHLCQFSVKKGTPPEASSASEPGPSLRGQKRNRAEASAPILPAVDGDLGEPEDGLKVWGYMPGHVHYKVADAEDGSNSKESTPQSAPSDAVQKILHAVPPRSITDAFVNHFLTVVNYRYSAVYGPTLTAQYVQWWSDRAQGKPLSPEFTCLLLRICAYSVQYLTPQLRKMIEFELACSLQTLTDRFATAADQLSQSFEASNTCIERVQEQFLKGAWLKSESKIVESWHALGCTIREAQELGIDKDSGIEGLSEFDIEIRRRIWTLLYIWDWQMGAWLGRPNLIDQKNLHFKFPNLRLDQSTTEENLLSPFAHMALQAKLGRRIAAVLNDVTSRADLNATHVVEVETTCNQFIAELPAIFRLEDPDTSLDKQHPYFIFQRHQLHCVIYVTMLDFFKPYLTRERRDKKSDLDDSFRIKGVDMSLKLLAVARRLFDHEFPINAKFHFVVFSIFDTATLLCSAIIHDRDHFLPRRPEIVDAVENALDMLHQLSLTTKLGASSYSFLHKLVKATPELSTCQPMGKRQKMKLKQKKGAPVELPQELPQELSQEFLQPAPLPEPEPEAQPLEAYNEVDAGVSVTEASMPLPLVNSAPPYLDHALTSTTTDDLNFDLDSFLAQNPFGGIEDDTFQDMQIWHWDVLNLENPGGEENQNSIVHELNC